MDRGEVRHLVWIVDDDARAVRALAKMLRDDGFAVEGIADGRTAVDRLVLEPLPSVLVTETVLPGVDGTAVAREARKRLPTLPVIFITGYPHLAAKATDLAPPPLVMTKPVDYDQLVNHLRAMMGTSVL